MMRTLLVLLLFFIGILCGILALGVGIGYLIHAIWSEIDLGMGILIGVVSGSVSIHFYARLAVSMDSEAEEEHLSRWIATLPETKSEATRRRRKRP